jgi:hypothetical protein
MNCPTGKSAATETPMDKPFSDTKFADVTHLVFPALYRFGRAIDPLGAVSDLAPWAFVGGDCPAHGVIAPRSGADTLAHQGSAEKKISSSSFRNSVFAEAVHLKPNIGLH